MKKWMMDSTLNKNAELPILLEFLWEVHEACLIEEAQINSR